MSLIEWDDSMSVGVASLDAQHKELIATADEFAKAFFDGNSQQVMGRILSRLIAFTKTHFQAEENLMIQYGFEGFYQHREEHKELTRQILELQERHENGDRNVPVETFNFLRIWFMHHILEIDMLYKEFFVEQGVDLE